MNKEIKKNFIDAKNKKFIHYLIYLEIKGKDINKGFNSKMKGFNKMMDKLFFVLKLLKYKEKNIEYLKYPFPSVSEKDFLIILSSLEYKIKNP